jgi:hypothetical protein
LDDRATPSGRTPSLTRSWISVDTISEVSARRLDNVTTCPDATLRPRIFRVSFTDAKQSDNEDRPDARPSRLDVVLFWEELLYFGKVVPKKPFGRS